MQGKLAGKRAIVTGGADGSEGLTAAEGMLRAGAQVSLWDEDASGLAKARAELEAQGLEADYQTLNLADPDAVIASYAATRAAIGDVDILLCNATLKNSFMMGPENPYPYQPVNFWDLNLDRFKKTLDVNVMGTYLCMRAVAADMAARGQGSIINMSTQDRTKRSPEHIPYGPSKALVENLSFAAAEQLKPFGVRVNVLQAGGRMNRRGLADPNNQPHDVMVPVLVYLSSDDSVEITGEIYTADRFNKEMGR
jgi:NAD(P)-dependent dehydrogenase (short-subunit alcohol dehydrogenase family)